jgi:hypothetical protein
LKLIAHRGWCAGPEENTPAAFVRAAADPRLAGVEFDICRDARSGEPVVAHDPPLPGQACFGLDAALSFLAGTRLELLVEVKQPGLAETVIERVVAAGLAERAVLCGFAPVARSFPWQRRRPVRLGAILPYPWTMRRFLAARAPDVVLLGWDARPWTRIACQCWWSVFSLERLARRCGKPVVAGIVRRSADLRWLERQNVDAAVVDMDCLEAEPDMRLPG